MLSFLNRGEELSGTWAIFNHHLFLSTSLSLPNVDFTNNPMSQKAQPSFFFSLPNHVPPH